MTEQSKDYSRGYAAGQRRAERERHEHERAMARYALAAAIAPEIVRNPWQQDGKAQNTVTGVASTVADLVREIERRL